MSIQRWRWSDEKNDHVPDDNGTVFFLEDLEAWIDLEERQSEIKGPYYVGKLQILKSLRRDLGLFPAK